MSKIIYVLIAILIYMIINLFIVIKKNTKILHFAGSILFLQVFLLSVVNSHFITLSEYSVCEYIFLFCMTIYAILVYFLRLQKKMKKFLNFIIICTRPQALCLLMMAQI